MVSKENLKYHERQLGKIYDDIEISVRELDTDRLYDVKRTMENVMNYVEHALEQLDRESFKVDVKQYNREQ